MERSHGWPAMALASMLAGSGGGASNGPDPGGPSPGSDADSGPAADAPFVQPDTPVAGPDYGETWQSPDDQAFVQGFLQVLDESEGMTYDELSAKYDPARQYLESMSTTRNPPTTWT